MVSASRHTMKIEREEGGGSEAGREGGRGGGRVRGDGCSEGKGE